MPPDLKLNYYRLDANGEPERCEYYDFDSRKTENFIIKVTRFKWGRVSTVLLPFDHSLRITNHDPIYFETMIFGGPRHGLMYRCGGSRADALKQHEQALDDVSMVADKEFPDMAA